MKKFFHTVRAEFQQYFSARHQKKALEKFQNDLLDIPSFLFLTLLAAVIAAFGIISNNEPVLIGAMIITPFINPFVGVSLGLRIWNEQLILMSLIRSIFGVGIFFGVVYVMGHFFPPSEVTSATFVMRSSPLTTPDVAIAIASGLVAASAFAFEKIHSRLTGAAIAVSLAPPLAVSAIGLAIKSPEMFQNALMLFAVNIGGIFVMSFLVFLAFGFQEHSDLNE